MATDNPGISSLEADDSLSLISRFSIKIESRETMMIRPVLVRALPNHRLYLEFSDGSTGEVDLSDLTGRGVFKAWDDQGFFQKVHIGVHREIKWNDEIELCSDSLYLRLTGKTPEELFPKLRREQPHA